MAVDQPKIVKLTIALLFLFSFALCISSFCSSRQCYVSPCYEGDGLDMLWSVDGGRSFQLVCIALMCFAHVFSAYWLLFKASFDEVKYGMLVAWTAILSVVLLCQAIYWGEEVLMMDGLTRHLGSLSFYEYSDACKVGTNETSCGAIVDCFWTEYDVCQRAMRVDTTAKAKFNSVVAFSVLLGLTHAAFAYMLMSWKDEFGEIFGGVVVHRRSHVPPPSSSPTVEDKTDMGQDGQYQSYQDENLTL